LTENRLPGIVRMTPDSRLPMQFECLPIRHRKLNSVRIAMASTPPFAKCGQRGAHKNVQRYLASVSPPIRWQQRPPTILFRLMAGFSRAAPACRWLNPSDHPNGPNLN